MTHTPSIDVAVIDPIFSDAERYALAAFLAGYRGLTRDACALDLRQSIAWCEEHNLRLRFGARYEDYYRRVPFILPFRLPSSLKSKYD